MMKTKLFPLLLAAALLSSCSITRNVPPPFQPQAREIERNYLGLLGECLSSGEDAGAGFLICVPFLGVAMIDGVIVVGQTLAQ